MARYERIKVKARQRAILFRVDSETETQLKGYVVRKDLEEVARIEQPFAIHIEAKMRDRDTKRTYYRTTTLIPIDEIEEREAMIEDWKYGELVPEGTETQIETCQ